MLPLGFGSAIVCNVATYLYAKKLFEFIPAYFTNRMGARDGWILSLAQCQFVKQARAWQATCTRHALHCRRRNFYPPPGCLVWHVQLRARSTVTSCRQWLFVSKQGHTGTSKCSFCAVGGRTAGRLMSDGLTNHALRGEVIHWSHVIG
mgnify:CR=1 FL=1